MAENENPNQINIELSEEMAEGIYSNLALISHMHNEFVVDFLVDEESASSAAALPVVEEESDARQAKVAGEPDRAGA